MKIYCLISTDTFEDNCNVTGNLFLDRDAAIAAMSGQYARMLESLCMEESSNGSKHYLCASCGFTEITFESSKDHPTANPTACPLVLPNGAALQVAVYQGAETTYPCINIDLVADGGITDRVCFVEYNPSKEPGHELCIGVYCAEQEDTVFYDSFVQNCGETD